MASRVLRQDASTRSDEKTVEDIVVQDLVEDVDRKHTTNARAVPRHANRGRDARQREGKRVHWQKGKLLGSGGFGHVYLGMDASSGTLIAAKEFVFDTNDSQMEKKMKQLKNEVKVMRELKHPNIVRYIASDRKGVKFHIFMEYVPGGSLLNLLQQFGPMSERVAAGFTLHILYGLDYLHRHRIIHRDIKCANVLVSVDGVVKLADFGSAQYFGKCVGIHGTPFWMAPEVVNNEFSVSWKADIWSLGCTILEMLTGLPPFTHIGDKYAVMNFISGNDTIHLPQLPANAESFIRLCLVRNPLHRASIQDLMSHEFLTANTSGGTIHLEAQQHIAAMNPLDAKAHSPDGGEEVGAVSPTSSYGRESTEHSLHMCDSEVEDEPLNSVADLDAAMKNALIDRAFHSVAPPETPTPSSMRPASAHAKVEKTVVTIMRDILDDAEMEVIDVDEEPATPITIYDPEDGDTELTSQSMRTVGTAASSDSINRAWYKGMYVAVVLLVLLIVALLVVLATR